MKKKIFTRKMAVLATALLVAVLGNTYNACAKQKAFSTQHHNTRRQMLQNEEKHLNGTAFSPFELVATLEAVYDDDGNIDEVNTYGKTMEVGDAIAAYIHETDESIVLDFPANWVVAGGDSADDIKDALLLIPSKQRIDSTAEPSPSNTKKIKVIEVCNKLYASKALGVLPITNDQTLANGFIHAPALPCEISVHNEDGQIKIYMLNAEAIFSLFFTDVLTGEQILEPDFAAKIKRLPKTVKMEMRHMILAALEYNNYEYKKSSEMAGPIYENIDAAINTVELSENHSPYVHFTYHIQNENTNLNNIVTTIMQTMTIHGDADAGSHDTELENLLSAGSSWRSARGEPLKMPGGNLVIEACSPKYAKMAISSTRLDHAPALPCEIAFKIINDGTDLLVTFLDPHFMFDAMFGDMSDEEKKSLGDLPAKVLNDLQTIVEYSIENNLDGIVLDAGEQVYYDMLQ